MLHKALSWAFPGVEALAEASSGGAEGPLTPQTFTQETHWAQKPRGQNRKREIKVVVDIRGKTRLPV